MKARLSAWVVAAIAGAVAVLWAGGGHFVAELSDKAFFMTRDADDPLRVTEEKPFILPQLYADFDLEMTVDIPEDGELDFVFRHVFPRRVRDAEGTDRFVQFHNRFNLLRLSASAEGPPYRTREEALFADELSGGVKLRAGVPASLRIEARGRSVRANVAGRWLPWTETTDDFGGGAFLVRGGVATVSYLKLTPINDSSGSGAWVLGAIAALLLAVLATACGSRPVRTVLAFLVVPIGAWGARSVVLAGLVPWAAPSDAGMLLGALAGLPVALAIAVRPRVWTVALALACGLVMLESSARVERPRLSLDEDPRLDHYFGPASGTAPFDVLARRIPQGVGGWHTLAAPGRRVMFLGGSGVFERGEDLNQRVALRVGVAVGRELNTKVADMVLPPGRSRLSQQILTLRRFYAPFAPSALVCAVTGAESDSGTGMSAEIAAGGPTPTPVGASVLVELLFGEAADVPATSTAELLQSLEDLRAFCGAHDIALVLASEPDAAPELISAAESFAAQHELAFVGNVLTKAGKPRLTELVEELAKRL